MQVICHCGNILIVEDIRLVPTATPEAPVLTIVVKPCASCRATAYHQGYRARCREAHTAGGLTFSETMADPQTSLAPLPEEGAAP
jgi:hypothetical protein